MTDLLPYSLEFTLAALNDLERLEHKISQQIVAKLERHAENVQNVQHEALKGRWAGLFSLHSGHYRAIYRMDHNERLIVVEAIGHRREVYKR
jgi:mRNA interferase RelE/StbE